MSVKKNPSATKLKSESIKSITKKLDFNSQQNRESTNNIEYREKYFESN